MALNHALCAFCLAMAGWAWGQGAGQESSKVVIRFMDSATGYAIRPDIEAQPHRPGAARRRFDPAHTTGSGHAALVLERGRHTVTASSPMHAPVSGEVEVRENFPYEIRFLLDPLEMPSKLKVEDITSRCRQGSTLFQGFIVDEDSSEPLGGVRVSSWPSGVNATSDARGFFELYVPVPDPSTPPAVMPSGLVFEKPGYRAEERQHLELWSGGDWTYTVRLSRGGGRKIVDERHERRQETRGDPNVERSAVDAEFDLVSTAPAPQYFPEPAPGDFATNTIRVPRNIRVEKNGIIYYLSLNYYTKHVLPHEWLASWNSICLRAGSIPVRCYAIARINGRSPTSDNDICGTSSCQVFSPNSTSSKSDAAVDFTEGYVLVNASGNIPSTEYSAENNSIDRGECGDGFTAPSGGCLYDPICMGRSRSGHGRGMCQRGSQRWGSGANGFPVRDWVWIVNHYYPNLTLFKGAELVVGDRVRSRSSDCNVRACPGGGIENGILCPLITTKSPGQTGLIIGGPLVVTNDGKGFTWWEVQWNDASSTRGWSCENYIERLFSPPTAPASLMARAVGTDVIRLSWTDTSEVETGFSIERAPGAAGPWVQIGIMEADVTTFTNASLFAGSTWHYRVRAFNAEGNTAYTPVASATTPSGIAPVLALVHDKTITPGTLLTVTNVATAPERHQLLADFEAFRSETANGVVLLRTPNFSTTTSGFLDASPHLDLAAVTDTYPTSGHDTGKVLYVHCSFTNASSPWMRLTTAGASSLPNPVINLNGKLRFDVYADQEIKVAVGCRETSTSAGTPVGADGGTTGSSIEWAGVTNISASAPVPTRTVTSNAWTTITFDFRNEPIRSFSGGNHVLSTVSGLGVLEHLAIVPAGALGVYSIYLDNFAVVAPRTFTYTLGPGAPTNATLDTSTGVFTWSPTEGQSPSTNEITIIVTDDSSPALGATNTFTVTVWDSVPNGAPLLAPVNNQTVYAGSMLAITNAAFDPNPADVLTFSLDPGAPPTATIHPITGVFTWTPSDADTNAPHFVTMRVSDNGVPQMSATAGFWIAVMPAPPPNRAPMLAPIANRTINAGRSLVFTNLAFDPDGDSLVFSLGPGAPGGASVHPQTGVFSWTPADADSNTIRAVAVRVTDDGVPPLSGSASFSVTVLPRLPNNPPVLQTPPDRIVHAGSTMVFTQSASDPDEWDTLRFSLDELAPQGAQIDTATGLFTWTPVDTQAGTTNSITVSVTDDGEPPETASATFVVDVRSRPVLENVQFSGEGVVLTWSAIPQLKYRVLYKDNISASNWLSLGNDITASGPSASGQDQGYQGASQRFYRIQVLEDVD